MILPKLIPILGLLLPLLASSAQASWSHHGQNYMHGEGGDCPTDTSGTYDAECLGAAIPPHPYCLKEGRTAAEWVDHAIDTAKRCCKPDGDLSECKCPVKNGQHFQEKIDAKCDGIAKCSEQKVKSVLSYAETQGEVVSIVESRMEENGNGRKLLRTA